MVPSFSVKVKLAADTLSGGVRCSACQQWHVVHVPLVKALALALRAVFREGEFSQNVNGMFVCLECLERPGEIESPIHSRTVSRVRSDADPVGPREPQPDMDEMENGFLGSETDRQESGAD